MADSDDSDSVLLAQAQRDRQRRRRARRIARGEIEEVLEEEEIEVGLRVRAEYMAMLKHEQERDYCHYQHAQDYDAVRAEEAAREAAAELEQEQDFEIQLEEAIRA